jgi:hypothetical protein
MDKQDIKEFYKKIAIAIYKKGEYKRDKVRPLIRDWCMLFERSDVKFWNRDEFLDECVEVSKNRDRYIGKNKSNLSIKGARLNDN